MKSNKNLNFSMEMIIIKSVYSFIAFKRTKTKSPPRLIKKLKMDILLVHWTQTKNLPLPLTNGKVIIIKSSTGIVYSVTIYKYML